MEPSSASTASSLSHREVIHDLRNLFGVVAAAKHLLAKRPADGKRTFILDALEGAALRGGQLTTELLASSAPGQQRIVDLNAHILGLEPMIRALLGGDTAYKLDLYQGCLPVRVNQAGLEGAILELVANARAALAVHGRITVRTRLVGNRIWLGVADNGRGMSPIMLERAMRGGNGGANGTGLNRVRTFLREAHGRFHIRSREQRGTMVCMNLPMVLSAALGEPIAPSGRMSPSDKESKHENRQPATA